MTQVKLRDLSPQERREHLLDQLYAKLDEPDLPGHAYARISASIAAMEKLLEASADDGKPVAQDLGPALAALPVEHATEMLVAEMARLEASVSSYRERLVELVGEDEAKKAPTV